MKKIRAVMVGIVVIIIFVSGGHYFIRTSNDIPPFSELDKHLLEDSNSGEYSLERCTDGIRTKYVVSDAEGVWVEYDRRGKQYERFSNLHLFEAGIIKSTQLHVDLTDFSCDSLKMSYF